MTNTIEARLLANETPEHLVARLVDLADVRPGHHVLEPSAGDGRLAFEAVVRGATVMAYDLNLKACEHICKVRDATEIDKSTLSVRRTDFLMTPVSPAYDRVIMNPPKDNVSHVLHAVRFLKPGGWLVALIHAQHAQTIANRLDQSIGVHMAALPSDMFHFDGKPIQALILLLRVPE